MNLTVIDLYRYFVVHVTNVEMVLLKLNYVIETKVINLKNIVIQARPNKNYLLINMMLEIPNVKFSFEK